MTKTQPTVSIIIVMSETSTAADLHYSFFALRGVRSIDVIVTMPASSEPIDFEMAGDGVAPRLVTYDQSSVTVSHAVNRAFGLAASEIVLVLSAGVFLPRNSIERLSAYCSEDSQQFISCLVQLVRPTDTLTDDDLHAIVEAGVEQRTDTATLSRAESNIFLAMHRSIFATLRGFDHEVGDLGTSVNDFTKRSLRFGYRHQWEVDGVQVIKIAPRLNAKTPSAPTRALPAAVTSKGAIFRNLRTWDFSSNVDAPLVSVVISTFNRSEYLPDCLNSILAQSFKDFEVVLVGDGCTDATKEVVQTFSDPRIKYFDRENEGISAARNFGTRVARGVFIAVHDDDDIMLPWRLERQLQSFGAGDHGSFGVSVHFDNETGELARLVHRKFNVQTALRYGHNPTHPTWMIKKSVFQQFGYDETLKSGVDNNLALRMIRSGIKLRHTGESLILRRMHGSQITRTAGEIQNSSAKMSQRLLKFANGLASDPSAAPTADEWLPAANDRPFEVQVRPYLPDHLIRRTAIVRTTDASIDLGKIGRSIGVLDFRLQAQNEDLEREDIAEVHNVTLAGMAELRRLGLDYELRLTDEVLDSSQRSHAVSTVLDWVNSTFVRPESEPHYRILVIHALDAKTSALLEGCELTGFSCLSDNSFSSAQGFVSVPLSFLECVRAYNALHARPAEGGSISILSVGTDGFPSDFLLHENEFQESSTK
ncbi:glycosyltransferase family 2 protein [Arthrobacter sp. L77]|uniref:glycosyltransferase family 2 protein n=1 Tax=Arthrobacter sp. L77 TaxID=1496689 RepID=UPI0009E1DFEF|nr:glycosyltransferase family 2 protein [Arthrobacter sp. L77]